VPGWTASAAEERALVGVSRVRGSRKLVLVLKGGGVVEDGATLELKRMGVSEGTNCIRRRAIDAGRN